MRLLPLLTLAVCPSLLLGQEDATARDLTKKVREGGTLFPSEWRRGPDGRLEVAVARDAEHDLVSFAPLVSRYVYGGPAGWLSLFCHGSDDLVSMTDAEFHFRCLGIGTGDVELRQFLAIAPKAPNPDAERAATFDRMLAMDMLRRRNCKQALAELLPIADDTDAPPDLRERARAVAAALRGETVAVARRRLDPESMPLPATFDGALVVDHARLPDMSWLTAAGRRWAMLSTAQAWDRTSRELPDEIRRLNQRNCDVVAEMPFDAALRYGNGRIDHSCVTVTVRADDKAPVSMQVSAAGAFDARAAQAVTDLNDAAPELRGPALTKDALAITAETFRFHTDKNACKPRPDAAKELLEDTGAALRVVIPPQSRLWPLLVAMGLPSASGADLRVTFGEACMVSLRVRARDEDGADAWVERGKEVLAQARAETPPQLLARIEKSPEVKLVLGALANAQFATEAEFAIVTIELRDLDRRALVALVEQLMQ